MGVIQTLWLFFLKIQQDYAIMEICHRSSDDLIDSESIILYLPGGSIISFEIKCTSVRCYQNSQGCEVLMKFLSNCLYIFQDKAQVWKWKWKWQRVERGRVWRQEQVQSRVPAQCEKVLEGKNGKTSWILKEQYTDLVDRAAVPGLRLHPHRQRPPRRQGKAVGEDLATFSPPLS